MTTSDNEETPEEEPIELPSSPFNGDFVSNTEQMVAHMMEVAAATSFYNDRLIELGLDHNVVAQLVVDWHKSFWFGAHQLPDFLDEEDEERNEL